MDHRILSIVSALSCAIGGAAIALQTGRAKDKAGRLQFVEGGALEAKCFRAILARRGPVDRWREFERTFLQGGT